MDDDTMAVDPDAPRTPHSSRSGHPFTSFSSTVHPLGLLLLGKDELDVFNRTMNDFSNRHGWQSRIGDDVSKLRFLFSDVLAALTSSFVHTALNAKIINVTPLQADQLILNWKDNELEGWQHGVQIAIDSGNWLGLASHPQLRKPVAVHVPARSTDPGDIFNRKLTKAYETPFFGDAAVDFVKYLERTDEEERTNRKIIYAKVVDVVQSSGTGKSRMLTEAGRQIFTLPICMRAKNDPGYPPSDVAVVDYFTPLTKDNDLNISAHAAIACFLAAAHEIMLEWLQKAQKENKFDGSQLHTYWYELMEPRGARGGRNQFFAEVVERATSYNAIMEGSWNSPFRSKTGDLEHPDHDPTVGARKFYNAMVKKATEDLMKFLSTLRLPQDLSVTYFDEAPKLGLCSRILLRLLSNQESSTRMWYVFMGTTSSIPYYTPCRSNLRSVHLKMQLVQTLPPYLALGFDQRMTAKGGAVVNATMGDLRNIEYLSQYGRPLWSAQLPEERCGEMVSFASLKLTGGRNFSETDRDHVFPVLSQRLCLDPVLVDAEAVQLADQSVARHMRLLTGFSPNDGIFYTHSPSEPILVLGSIDILYNNWEKHRLASVLNTLSNDLCRLELIEKGASGELGARTILLIARDFAAPRNYNGRDLLKPVSLVDFLRTLFGNKIWAGSNQELFDAGLRDANVNFTHWMMTRDPMPEVPNIQLLANLWARGAALQCCSTQESVDFLIPIYIGSVAPNTAFDSSRLSVVAGQVKFKVAEDKKAEAAIRPNGIPRDLRQPLPYLAILMELGNESEYQESCSKIRSTVPEAVSDDKFEELTHAWIQAAKRLEAYGTRPKKKQKKTINADLKNALTETQLLMDSSSRYSISVRGASPDVYGILREARIVTEFSTLLSITMPSPSNQDRTMQYMQPLERLGGASGHTAWMSEFVLSRDLSDRVDT